MSSTMKLSFSILWLLAYFSIALCNYTLLEPEDVPPLEDYDELDCSYKRWSKAVRE
jgi:hypothetical protein